MGLLQPISKRDKRTKGISLTIGVDGRMYLSKGLRERLKHNKSSLYYLYYDRDNQRIGISHSCPDNHIEPFTFNKNGEGKVVEFVEDCEIELPGQPIVWLYEGQEKNVLVFYKKGRTPMALKQARNGDLERMGG